MLKKYLYVIFVLLSWMVMNACNQRTSLHTINRHTSTDLQEFFAYSDEEEGAPLISGHRGGAQNGYPENSIASLEYTLSHTPATFEVDPRLTKDSVIVLMHDETLERTTNGMGKISDYTWEELQELKLKDPEGNITKYGIPSLDEVIEWSRGKTIINLDEKDVPKSMTAAKIADHQAESHVIVTVHDAGEAGYYYEKNKEIMLSAWIRTEEAFEEYEESVPWEQIAQAYIGPEISSEKQKLINRLHQAGVKVMIGAGPSYDKLEPEERGAAYRELIRSGVDIIETDRPVEAAKAIRLPATDDV